MTTDYEQRRRLARRTVKLQNTLDTAAELLAQLTPGSRVGWVLYLLEVLDGIENQDAELRELSLVLTRRVDGGGW